MAINAVLLKAQNTPRLINRIIALIFITNAANAQAMEPKKGELSPERICHLIARESATNGLPPSFFARLLWKESLFDTNAISPAGAQGIAQFMPSTAKQRNLANPFDPEQAIPASAAYLSKLRVQFGNLGLAAAAYNSGEARVGKWLTRGGTLPIETENYVLDITGEASDAFFNKKHQIAIRKLDPKLEFRAACVQLATSRTLSDPMSARLQSPWAIQVAGNYKRSIAQRAWSRVRTHSRSIVDALPMAISRSRSARGKRGIFTVRLGASSRSKANKICGALRANGHSCIVIRNQ